MCVCACVVCETNQTKKRTTFRYSMLISLSKYASSLICGKPDLSCTIELIEQKIMNVVGYRSDSPETCRGGVLMPIHPGDEPGPAPTDDARGRGTCSC